MVDCTSANLRLNVLSSSRHLPLEGPPKGADRECVAVAVVVEVAAMAVARGGVGVQVQREWGIAAISGSERGGCPVGGRSVDRQPVGGCPVGGQPVGAIVAVAVAVVVDAVGCSLCIERASWEREGIGIDVQREQIDAHFVGNSDCDWN